jgi:hypothetical protein
MLIFSAGGPVKAIIYGHLPLLNYIRYNGQFRVFSILCFCVIAGFGLQRLFNKEINYSKYFKLALQLLLTLSACVFVALAIFNGRNIAASLNIFSYKGTLIEKIKCFLASPFPVFLFIGVLITAAVCIAGLYAQKTNRFKWLLAIIIVDVCINSILYLPITGVGQKTLKTIQAVYSTSPKGIPIPPLVPVNKIDTLNPVLTGLVGDITFYNKKIGTTRLTNYPSYFTSTDNFFQNKALAAGVFTHPYLFIKSSDTLPPAGIQVQAFYPQEIMLQVNARQNDTVVFLQNRYTFWHAAVNNNTVALQTAYKTFMAVKLNAGLNTVEFYYDDRWLYGCLVISLLAFLTCFVIIYRSPPTYK